MAKIIVIEDEADLRGLLRIMLEAQGHEVDEANNGSEALSEMGRKRYDLVITDVLMPEQDGVAMMKQVPELQPQAKVLAISGGGPTVPADWSLKMMMLFGVNAALHKPFDESDLIDTVDKLLAS